METKIIRASRWRLAVQLLVCVAVATLGGLASAYLHERNAAAFWVSVAFDGMGVLAALMTTYEIARPFRLHLQPEVLIWEGMGKRHAVPWADIEEFYVIRFSRFSRMIAFTYRAGCAPNGLGATIGGGLAGSWPGGVPNTLKLLNEELDLRRASVSPEQDVRGLP